MLKTLFSTWGSLVPSWASNLERLLHCTYRRSEIQWCDASFPLDLSACHTSKNTSRYLCLPQSARQIGCNYVCQAINVCVLGGRWDGTLLPCSTIFLVCVWSLFGETADGESAMCRHACVTTHVCVCVCLINSDKGAGRSVISTKLPLWNNSTGMPLTKQMCVCVYAVAYSCIQEQ